MFVTKLLSSLEKVFLDEEPKAERHERGMALRGEKYSFQLAYSRDFEGEVGTQRYRLEMESPLSDSIRLFAVRSVPCEVPAYLYEQDDYYLRTKPGLYPDVLDAVQPNFILMPWQWRSIWVMVDVPEKCKPGVYPITLRMLKDETGKPNPVNDGKVVSEDTFELEVLPAKLPPQKMLYTQWLHNDCLCNYYHVDIWSEEYWRIVANYMRNAAEYGLNLILTPIFTPPLDTLVGGERMTVQLVDVERTAPHKYEFGFDKLERYMKLAEECGIHNFEMSHLFTQWGAAHAPKIIAKVDGKDEQIFGWETDSVSDEYQNFLKAFIRALLPWLKEREWLDKTYFHFSDEPHIEHLEKYAAAAAVARELLKKCHVIDALSEFEFYERGLIRQPIPSTSKVLSFQKKGVQPLWTYYCCDQAQKVSNRFISMPSDRNRVIGFQLYKYNVKGFLHWGYNFWNSQFSLMDINPYEMTDAMNAFQSGDAFSVYPGRNGEAVSSLRQVVFNEALQDMRALKLLETVMPKGAIISKMDQATEAGVLTFKDYPHSAEAVLRIRNWVNEEIKYYFEKYENGSIHCDRPVTFCLYVSK
ncbi:MAG: DUF4091 domain-containing protein [Clostridia bacterium]|nr:DUF4091 domain-containing protein [Clostridia bacterium]